MSAEETQDILTNVAMRELRVRCRPDQFEGLSRIARMRSLSIADVVRFSIDHYLAAAAQVEQSRAQRLS